MPTIKTHMASDETLTRVADALEMIARAETGMRYDPEKGEYTGIGLWFQKRRDGKAYSVKGQNTASVSLTKTDANAGIAVPTPGTNDKPAVDPYATVNAFYHVDVNGYPDADGRPHVTAIDGDGLFRRDGTNGNVCVMAPVLWWKLAVSGTSWTLSVSDSPLPGFSPQPEALLPDGSLRECMLYPKYAMGTYGGKPASVSGIEPRTRDVSHDSLITQVIKTNGEDESWTGKTLGVDWYLKAMFMLKYATRNSQSVFQGCVSYDVTKQPTAASSSAAYIDVAKGHGFLQGSAIMVGTQNADRGNAAAYDVVRYAVIESITSKDGSNDRLNLNQSVTVATSNYIKTAPWPTGSCDGVYGDGSPYNTLSGKEPFTLQGIEAMVGVYEVLGNIVLKNDGSSGLHVYINHDATKETTSVSSVHEDTGVSLPTDDADSWKYPTVMASADGFLCGTDKAGSSTTGMCDGHYTNKMATTGERELHSLGSLDFGPIAGLFCLTGNSSLSYARWNIASRLSATGRSRGESA